MGTFIDSTHMKLVSFEVIFSGCNALVVPFQHRNRNPNPLANQLWWLPYSSHTSHRPSQTPCLPWISCKMVQKQSEVFLTFSLPFFPSLKQNFIAYRSSKVSSLPDCIFEIHQLWQSGFSRVYSNCCCSCWFEPEIIKIGQSSHKMYSYNILNFQESTTCLYKKVWKWLNVPRIYIYIYIYNERDREWTKRIDPALGWSCGMCRLQISRMVRLSLKTKLHLMLSLLFWIFSEWEVPPKLTLTRTGSTF